MIVKDLRVFRRDPVQWSQFLIFFGLLGLYFLNIRSLIYDVSRTEWVVVISFLNLGVVGLILSTFTSRFVFPMISLEGQRFWILGRLPIRRDTILWSKFLFASLGSIVPCAGLILISDRMLGVDQRVVAVHMLIVLLLSAGLSGIAVGLGARLPNLQAESPSKIAAGFGGTLTLVLSAVYIAIVVLVAAVPCHFVDTAPRELGKSELAQTAVALGVGSSQGIINAALFCVAMGVVTTLAPMWIGFRAFRRMEF